MAVVPSTARLTIDDTALHTTSAAFVATFDTAQAPDAKCNPGDKVVIHFSRTNSTPGIPEPETVSVIVYDDNRNVVKTFAVNPPTSTLKDFDFWATHNGDDPAGGGGTSSAGTLELAIRVSRTTAPAYDIESSLTPNSPPTGYHAHLADRGYLRSGSGVAVSTSNIAYGGLQNLPFTYPDQVFVRLTCTRSYVPRAYVVRLNALVVIELPTQTTQTGPWEVTFPSSTFDDRWPGGVGQVLRTRINSPNAALTGLPDVHNFQRDFGPVHALDVCRVITHLFQRDDNVIGTPPLSKDVAMRRRVDQIGYLASRVANARGEGINGFTLEQVVEPSGGGGISGSSASATRGGETGWGELLEWSDSGPAGPWTKTVSITAPAEFTDVTKLLNRTATADLLSGSGFSVGWIPMLGAAAAVEGCLDDNFNRADTLSGLGTATSGQTYNIYGDPIWHIASNKADIDAVNGSGECGAWAAVEQTPPPGSHHYWQVAMTLGGAFLAGFLLEFVDLDNRIMGIVSHQRLRMIIVRAGATSTVIDVAAPDLVGGEDIILTANRGDGDDDVWSLRVESDTPGWSYSDFYTLSAAEAAVFPYSSVRHSGLYTDLAVEGGFTVADNLLICHTPNAG